MLFVSSILIVYLGSVAIAAAAALSIECLESRYFIHKLEKIVAPVDRLFSRAIKGLESVLSLSQDEAFDQIVAKGTQLFFFLEEKFSRKEFWLHYSLIWNVKKKY